MWKCLASVATRHMYRIGCMPNKRPSRRHAVKRNKIGYKTGAMPSVVLVKPKSYSRENDKVVREEAVDWSPPDTLIVSDVCE